MSGPMRMCPDCGETAESVSRREFLKAAGVAAVAVSTTPLWTRADAPESGSTPETVVKTLFESLNEAQKKEVCFDWGYVHPKMGLLRTRVANNWHITKPEINGDFF